MSGAPFPPPPRQPQVLPPSGVPTGARPPYGPGGAYASYGAAGPYAAYGGVPGLPTAAPKRGSLGVRAVVWIVAIVLLCVGFLAVMAFLMLSLGPTAILVGGLAALVPLAVVIGSVLWIDRWEPEPRAALVFAFLWGAAASVIIALLTDFIIQVALFQASEGMSTPSFVMSAVVQAPIVEELAKGAGILIVYFAWRRRFDSPVDGIVYAMTIAAGFAFTENILYFAESLQSGGAFGLTITFVLRGLMSPFAHAMFTAATGFAIGLAAQRAGSVGAVLGAFVIGVIPAILLHALWNGSSFIAGSGSGFFILYGIVQVPLFVGFILLILYLGRQERRLTADRLSEYAAAGWFTSQEVAMVSTGRGRAQARRWARAMGAERPAAMRSFLHDATRLAYARQRFLAGRDRVQASRDEAELLTAVTNHRAALLA